MQFGFVEPRIAVHTVLGQAGVVSPHGVTVRVSVTEKDFERAGRHKDELSELGKYLLYFYR